MILATNKNFFIDSSLPSRKIEFKNKLSHKINWARRIINLVGLVMFLYIK